MLRMFKELKGSYRYVVLIVLLLFGQAYCDLSLPAYTSTDIYQCGVQREEWRMVFRNVSGKNP